MPGEDPAITVNRLVAAGVSRQMPCAQVSLASMPAQQIVTTTLDELAKTEAHAKPAVLLIGDVIGLSESERAGLDGCFQQALMVTPAAHEIEPIAALRSQGSEAVDHG
jgi:precorrin-4 methylase